MKKCELHLDYANEFCPDCGLEVNEWGNTENRIQYCQFDKGACGCDGARNCMAEEGASEFANKNNFEAMWNTGSKLKSRFAVFNCLEKWK